MFVSDTAYATKSDDITTTGPMTCLVAVWAFCNVVPTLLVLLLIYVPCS